MRDAEDRQPLLLQRDDRVHPIRGLCRMAGDGCRDGRGCNGEGKGKGVAHAILRRGGCRARARIADLAGLKPCGYCGTLTSFPRIIDVTTLTML